jgi:5-(carboxyamino)imidazole ribonucleotide mutase
VIIATAGLSPSLPSIVAAHTDLPVIGVPLRSGPLGGLDTLLATVQAPPNTPVACMAIDGLRNAATFAANILSAMPLPPAG